MDIHSKETEHITHEKAARTSHEKAARTSHEKTAYLTKKRQYISQKNSMSHKI
jgi:hypothetical protein